MKPNQKQDIFPVTQAREVVKDLMTPDARIYWADFLASVTIGWGAFYLTLGQPLFGPAQVALYVVTALALYRAVIFTHELAHLKKGTFKFFRLVWNLTAGFPLLVPSFTYHGVHNDHHTRDVYGTPLDGEYIPFASKQPWHMITYVLLSFILPLFFAIRFLLLSPLGWMSKRLTRVIWERTSSLTIDLGYHRPGPDRRDDPTWRLQEVATFLYGWTAVLLVVYGIFPATVLVLWYAATTLVFILNSLRTLGAHAYRNPGDKPMTVGEQFLDSVNVPGRDFLNPLWAPVGLRYHATHHLFPKMPYHSLGEAHRRLAASNSIGTDYLKASRKSLPHALKTLWRDAGARVRTAG